MPDPAPEKLHRPEDYKPTGNRRLSPEDFQQIITELTKVVKQMLAARNPEAAAKLYSKRAFEACMKATGEGSYLPYHEQVARYQKEWEG